MPTYDYHCGGCGKTIEIMSSIYDDPAIPCPCGGILIRQFSPPRAKPILDIEPYWDHNITQEPIYITSRKHKAEVLKEHGLKMRKGLSDYR